MSSVATASELQKIIPSQMLEHIYLGPALSVSDDTSDDSDSTLNVAQEVRWERVWMMAIYCRARCVASG